MSTTPCGNPASAPSIPHGVSATYISNACPGLRGGTCRGLKTACIQAKVCIRALGMHVAQVLGG